MSRFPVYEVFPLKKCTIQVSWNLYKHFYSSTNFDGNQIIELYIS